MNKAICTIKESPVLYFNCQLPFKDKLNKDNELQPIRTVTSVMRMIGYMNVMLF
jgi:hypothetical protein